MKLPFLAALLLTLLVACGGGDSAPAEPPTEDELAAVLLTAKDVPSGFTLSKAESLESEYAVCKIEDIVSKDIDEEEVVKYTSGSDDLQLNLGYVLYRNGRSAAAVFDELAAVLKNCTSWREGSERIGQTYRVSQLTLAKLGDESIGVRVEAENVPVLGSIRADFVYARYGEVMMFFSNAAKKGQAANQDLKLTESLAKKAMDNLKGID